MAEVLSSLRMSPISAEQIGQSPSYQTVSSRGLKSDPDMVDILSIGVSPFCPRQIRHNGRISSHHLRLVHDNNGIP